MSIVPLTACYMYDSGFLVQCTLFESAYISDLGESRSVAVADRHVVRLSVVDCNDDSPTGGQSISILQKARGYKFCPVLSLVVIEIFRAYTVLVIANTDFLNEEGTIINKMRHHSQVEKVRGCSDKRRE
jgi:hypothetical protein